MIPGMMALSFPDTPQGPLTPTFSRITNNFGIGSLSNYEPAFFIIRGSDIYIVDDFGTQRLTILDTTQPDSSAVSTVTSDLPSGSTNGVLAANDKMYFITGGGTDMTEFNPSDESQNTFETGNFSIGYFDIHNGDDGQVYALPLNNGKVNRISTAVPIANEHDYGILLTTNFAKRFDFNVSCKHGQFIYGYNELTDMIVIINTSNNTASESNYSLTMPSSSSTFSQSFSVGNKVVFTPQSGGKFLIIDAVAQTANLLDFGFSLGISGVQHAEVFGNNLYMIALNESKVLKLNVVAETAQLIGPALTGFYSKPAFLGLDNKIYFMKPNFEPNFLIVDTVDDSVSESNLGLSLNTNDDAFSLAAQVGNNFYLIGDNPSSAGIKIAYA